MSEAILSAILEKLDDINDQLAEIKTVLAQDRAWMWKILALAILGAFALVGIKLVMP